MHITILVPCFNEERSIRTSVRSWLNQTRPADEIVVIDDSSTDDTPNILREFGDKITVVRTPRNFGNKSYAQEYGLQFVKGEVFVTTDADTSLKEDFVERIEKDFADPKVAAVGGYLRSLKYNWLTRHRSFEYAIGQNFHKLAQSHLGCMFVIPGAAGAFRTDVFRTYLTFDHDTLTEDLDFTYKLHKFGYKIHYNRHAIAYTQDPPTISAYVNQMRRWCAGGWQNLIKHYDIVEKPAQALELTMMYVEGVAFSSLFLVLPFINIRLIVVFVVPYMGMVFLFSLYAAFKEKRWDLLLVPFPYIFLVYLNAFVFMEQFVKEIILRRKHLVWFKPERIATS